MNEPSNRGVPFPEQHRQSDTGGLKEKAQDTLGAVKEKAQDLAGSAQQAWDSTKQQAHQAWDTTRQQASQMASNAGETFEEAFDSVNGFIRRYPLACVLGGVFIGFLAAGALSTLAEVRRPFPRYEP
jgi:hypothetical protein